MPAEQPVVRRAFLLRVSFIAGLGGILYGFDVGIIAAALLFVRNTFALSTHLQEIVVSVVPAGTMAGAIVGGILSDRLGRRVTLLWSGVIFIVGSILAPLSPNVGALIAARSLLGFAIGFTSVTAPVYVSELSPPQLRGMLIGMYQFALTLGIVFANLVGYWFASEQSWRLMFATGVLPAVVFLALVFTVPESPRWLFIKDRTEEGEQVLLSYTDARGAQILLDDIHLATELRQNQERWTALFTAKARRGIVIAVGFVVLQQLCGINTVIYYGPQIFALAGLDSNQHAIFASVLVSVMNMLATVIALFLVDRIGRKPLLYAGVGGMLASLLVLAFTFGHQANGDARNGNHGGCLPNGLHCLLRRQHGAYCMDSGRRSVSAPVTKPGSCSGNDWLRSIQYPGVANFSQCDPSHRECSNIRRVCSLLCGHVAVYTLRHSGD